MRPPPELIPRNDDLRAAGKQHLLHPDHRLIVHRADDVQAAAAVDYPRHVDAAVRLQDAQVGHVLQLGDQPLHVLFQGLRQRVCRRQHLLNVCPLRELLRNQLRRFLLADAVVVRHVAGLTQVKPGNQQILQGVLVEIAEQIQLRRFPRPQIQQGEVRAVRPEDVRCPRVPFRVEVHHRVPEIAYAANERVGGHHALAAPGQAEDLNVGLAPGITRDQHRLALLILTQKHRLLFPGLLRGKIGQRVNRYRLPEMQVADVGHFTGPLAAAPALLVQFRVHRLVSGRKMTVKQQERQQPRQHNPDNQPARAPGNPEQVSRLQQVIICVRVEVRTQDGFSPALDKHGDNKPPQKGQTGSAGQPVRVVPDMPPNPDHPPGRIQRGQHRKWRSPVIIALIAIGILPPLLMTQPHKTHPSGPEFSQTEKQADNQKSPGQTVILPVQPADPRVNLPGQLRDMPLPGKRIRIKHAISLLQTTGLPACCAAPAAQAADMPQGMAAAVTSVVIAFSFHRGGQPLSAPCGKGAAPEEQRARPSV
ncbi:Uncharacterised protein [Klebsiella pneumoniae]|nr:Uncharacterised protein [Klebsiella pneumoniae]